MFRPLFAAAASLLLLIGIAPTSTAAPADVITNQTTTVYRSQKFVYETLATFEAGAPAGEIGVLTLDSHTPLYAGPVKPYGELLDTAGRVLPITVTTTRVSATELRYTVSQPVPAGAVLRTRSLVSVSGAAAGDVVTSSFTADGVTVRDVDNVVAMPLVTSITKRFSDGRDKASPGDTLRYVATATFTGGPMDGTTLLIKESKLAPISGRPVVTVTTADGQAIAIDPERLMYSRFGDSVVWTILGGVPVGARITVTATATVSAETKPGDVIHAEFGVGLNNWDRSSTLERAIDETLVVAAPVIAPRPPSFTYIPYPVPPAPTTFVPSAPASPTSAPATVAPSTSAPSTIAPSPSVVPTSGPMPTLPETGGEEAGFVAGALMAVAAGAAVLRRKR